MTGGAWVFLIVAAALAVGDWVAVQRRLPRLEYVCKPLTVLALIGLALALDPVEDGRGWFVIALAFSLAGDVFLMLPQDLFLPGLASFLLAHVAYIGGLVQLGTSVIGWVAGVAVVVAATRLVGGPIVQKVRFGPDSRMEGPVTAYLFAISAMVATAVATGEPFAIVGALLFYCSDALIAITRFVRDQPWGRLAIAVTYHLAQLLLVLSLLG
jgi:uncharacterized membrane protein YhhN